MPKQSTAYDNGKLYRVLSILIVLICFGLALWAYPQLPEKVPAHWNLAGEVNRYTGRLSGAFLLPSIMLVLLAFNYVIPRIDPKRNNYKLMDKAYWATIFGITFFLGVMYFGIIIYSLGLVHFNLVPILVQVGIGLLFMVIGNYLPKVKYNYLFGIRNPWTLANEDVWYKTHRFMGPIFVVAGIIMAVAGFIMAFWFKSAFPILMPLVIVLALTSLAYAYISFRKINEG